MGPKMFAWSLDVSWRDRGFSIVNLFFGSKMQAPLTTAKSQK